MKLITRKFDIKWAPRCEADFDLVMTAFPMSFRVKRSEYFGYFCYSSRRRCSYYTLPDTVESSYDFILRRTYEIDKK